jgi:hypothetical protein
MYLAIVGVGVDDLRAARLHAMKKVVSSGKASTGDY